VTRPDPLPKTLLAGTRFTPYCSWEKRAATSAICEFTEVAVWNEDCEEYRGASRFISPSSQLGGSSAGFVADPRLVDWSSVPSKSALTADEWNDRYRVGTLVKVTLPNGEIIRTATASAAFYSPTADDVCVYVNYKGGSQYRISRCDVVTCGTCGDVLGGRRIGHRDLPEQDFCSSSCMSTARDKLVTETDLSPSGKPRSTPTNAARDGSKGLVWVSALDDDQSVHGLHRTDRCSFCSDPFPLDPMNGGGLDRGMHLSCAAQLDRRHAEQLAAMHHCPSCGAPGSRGLCVYCLHRVDLTTARTEVGSALGEFTPPPVGAVPRLEMAQPEGWLGYTSVWEDS
jgi:hypothetical protein